MSTEALLVNTGLGITKIVLEHSRKCILQNYEGKFFKKIAAYKRFNTCMPVTLESLYSIFEHLLMYSL